MKKTRLKPLLTKCAVVSLCATTVFSLSSCKEKNFTYINDSIAIVYQNKVPFLINENKDLFKLDHYDEIVNVFDEYIIVKKDNLYGFIKNTGEEIVKPTFTEVYSMKEKKAVVNDNGTYKIINDTGNVIYTFENGFISNNNFVENRLVVSKNNLFYYLTFNPDDNSFTISEDSFDYAASFSEGFGVVGKLIDGNMKYNFYSDKNELLFDEFELDFADSFHNGIARVGNYGEYTVFDVRTGSHDPVRHHQLSGMLYRYIDKDVNYLTYSDDSLAYPYASNFKNGYGIMAKYLYHKTLNKYVKEFMIINTDGGMDYIEPIFYETRYYYGLDIFKSWSDDRSFYYQTQSPSQNFFNDVITVNDTLVISTGNTLNDISWKMIYIKYDYLSNRYEFENVSWENLNFKESEITYDILPEWIINYNEKYLGLTKPSAFLATQAARTPYELNEFKYSEVTSSNIATSRIIRSNTYGLIELDYKEVYLEEYDTDETQVIARYILDPIYDQIFY